MFLRRKLSALALASLAFAGVAHAAGAPVVVELFQSQGCSSCPPANANVNAIAGRSDILALSYGVTYWDRLGWKDTFASKTFTDRQYAYARSLGHDGVGTPQVVIGGRRDVVGNDARGLDAAIRQAPPSVGPAITIQPNRVAVAAGSPPPRPAAVWLVRFDPRVRQVAIRRGENGGKTLPHRNVVVSLTRLGSWSGAPVTFAAPAASDPALRTAVLVQTAPVGTIIAAARN